MAEIIKFFACHLFLVPILLGKERIKMYYLSEEEKLFIRRIIEIYDREQNVKKRK